MRLLLSMFSLLLLCAAGPDLAAAKPGPAAKDSAREISGDSVLLVGDSLAVPLGPELARRFSGTGRVFDYLAKSSSGLARPDFFDWEKNLERLARKRTWDKVLVLLGTNDGQGLTKAGGGRAGFGSDEWRKEYGRRVQRIFDICREKNPACVIYWLGAPVMGPDSLHRKVVVVNQVIKARCGGNCNCYFVDNWDLLAEKGRYASHLNLNGKRVRVRAKDGVHLTSAGAKILAANCLRAIKPGPPGGTMLARAEDSGPAGKPAPKAAKDSGGEPSMAVKAALAVAARQRPAPVKPGPSPKKAAHKPVKAVPAEKAKPSLAASEQAGGGVKASPALAAIPQGAKLKEAALADSAFPHRGEDELYSRLLGEGENSGTDRIRLSVSGAPVLALASGERAGSKPVPVTIEAKGDGTKEIKEQRGLNRPAPSREAAAPPAKAPAEKVRAAARRADSTVPAYSIQESSWRTDEEAGKRVELLARMGVKSRVVAVDLGKRGTWHRVMIGGFDSLSRAKAFREELVRDHAPLEHVIILKDNT